MSVSQFLLNEVLYGGELLGAVAAVVGREPVRRVERDFVPPPADGVQAGIAYSRAEKRFRLSLRPDRVVLGPQPEEGFLQGVVGILVVSEDAPGPGPESVPEVQECIGQQFARYCRISL